jgi:hypothetical protein
MGHGRTTGRLQKLRTNLIAQNWGRPLTANNPHAVIPDGVLRQLASENISTVDEYNLRLAELPEQEKANGQNT